MKMVPYEKEQMPNRRKYTDMHKFLDEFIKSEHDCVKVTDFTHANAKSCVSGLRASIRRYRYSHVKVIQRGDNVFLVKVI